MSQYGQPNSHTILKTIGRGLVALAVCVPILCLTLIKSNSISNPYWLMLVSGLIPITGAGYILFIVAD